MRREVPIVLALATVCLALLVILKIIQPPGDYVEPEAEEVRARMEAAVVAREFAQNFPEDTTSTPLPAAASPATGPWLHKACAAGRMVLRSGFVRGVEDREPQENIYIVGQDVSNLFFYTEVFRAANQTLIHKWYFGEALVAEVPIEIGGERWRGWSSKTLSTLAEDKAVSVEVIDETGCVLLKRRIAFAGATAESIGPDEDRLLGGREALFDVLGYRREGAVQYEQPQYQMPQFEADIDAQARHEQTLRFLDSAIVACSENVPFFDPDYNGVDLLWFHIRTLNPECSHKLFIKSPDNESVLDLVAKRKDPALERAFFEQAAHRAYAGALIHVGTGAFEHRNGKGDTPLIQAVRYKDEEAILTWLADAINEKLLGATFKQAPTSTRLSIKPGLSPWETDSLGRRPIDIAEEYGYPGIASMLRHAMADETQNSQLIATMFSDSFRNELPNNCISTVSSAKADDIRFYAALATDAADPIEVLWWHSSSSTGDKRLLVRQSVPSSDRYTELIQRLPTHTFVPGDQLDVEIALGGKPVSVSKLTFETAGSKMRSQRAADCYSLGQRLADSLARRYSPASSEFVDHIAQGRHDEDARRAFVERLFFAAIRAGNMRLMRRLIDEGVNVDQLNLLKARKVPIHAALNAQKVDALGILLRAGAKVFYAADDPIGWSTLETAVYAGDVASLILLSSYVDLERVTEQESNQYLTRALSRCELDRAYALVTYYPSKYDFGQWTDDNRCSNIDAFLSYTETAL